MREPPTNICPLMALGPGSGPAVCIQERCAWWSYGDRECALVAIANAIREAGDT